LLKKGVGGVASAAPPQPLAVAGLLLVTLFKRKVFSARESSSRRELQKARHDTRIHFSAPC
jgi:hypothetical protein